MNKEQAVGIMQLHSEEEISNLSKKTLDEQKERLLKNCSDEKKKEIIEAYNFLIEYAKPDFSIDLGVDAFPDKCFFSKVLYERKVTYLSKGKKPPVQLTLFLRLNRLMNEKTEEQLSEEGVTNAVLQPLYYAILDNDIVLIEKLLSEYPIDEYGNYLTDKRLPDICYHGASLKLIKLLLNQGLNVNLADDQRKTLLHYLCNPYPKYRSDPKYYRLDSEKVIEFLLREPNVNVKDEAGNTPLHVLANSSDNHLFIKNIMVVLLKNGA